MIAELLASKWRAALGAWPSPENRDALAPGHALPWRFELPACLWVSCKRGMQGAPRLPAFGRTEASHICAAAELERLNPSDVERLCRAIARKGAKRPLEWTDVAGKVSVHPADAGAWTLGRVLARLGTELVRVEVIE